MRHPLFTDEHEELRRSVRSFVERELAPRAPEWEAAGHFSDDVFTRMGELDLLGLRMPEELGGTGGDWGHAIVVAEELNRMGSAGTAMGITVHTDMATPPIIQFGTDDLKQRYIPPAVRGEKIFCLAITEPDAGSDVAGIRTTARRDGDEYVINGAKTYITNGVRAHACTLVAKTDPEAGYGGFSIFVVDTDTPGWTVSKNLKKVGNHASDTAELAFQDMRVPAENLLGGEEGHGFQQIMWELQGERLIGAAGCLAGSKLMLEMTKEFVQTRNAFGRSISKFQTVRHTFAQLASEIEAAQQLTYNAAWQFDNGGYPVQEISMAKLLGGQVTWKVADACMQLHGGAGYMDEYPISRAWRDARLIRIGAGTDEIMKEIISKQMGL
jgi:citronellyl-CoA dehydrogenase